MVYVKVRNGLQRGTSQVIKVMRQLAVLFGTQSRPFCHLGILGCSDVQFFSWPVELQVCEESMALRGAKKAMHVRLGGPSRFAPILEILIWDPPNHSQHSARLTPNTHDNFTIHKYL